LGRQFVTGTVHARHNSTELLPVVREHPDRLLVQLHGRQYRQKPARKAHRHARSPVIPQALGRHGLGFPLRSPAVNTGAAESPDSRHDAVLQILQKLDVPIGILHHPQRRGEHWQGQG